MTIGQLAEQAEVGVETVRFYQRKGLLETPARTGAAYRQYTAEDVRRVRFIRRAKDLGFTLVEVFELMRLNEDARASRAEALKRAEAKIADIDARLSDLQRMRSALADLVYSCHHAESSLACPILEALDEPHAVREDRRLSNAH